MAKQSAGLILYRVKQKKLQVLLVHPGGPFWNRKDEGAWSIPKGETETGEELLDTAKREVREETGWNIHGNFIALDAVRQKSGKVVYGWAVNSDMDESTFKSNLFEIEWPPHSGKMKSFPEVDKAGWFFIEEAYKKIHSYQTGLLDQLIQLYKNGKL